MHCTYRAQVLHHCAVYGIPYILYVEANQETILYAVLLKFDEVVLDNYRSVIYEQFLKTFPYLGKSHFNFELMFIFLDRHIHQLDIYHK